MRTANLKIALLLVSALGVFAAASCIHENCAGATCAAPARFNLVLTESDSGGAGISTGELSGVAFALDSGREHVTTSPSLAVKMADDTYRQFPDKRLFVFPPGRTGVFEITATGGSMAAFTFHLVVGVLLPWPAYSSVNVRVGDIVVQQWGGGCGDGPPPALAAPAFDLIEDASPGSTTLVPASLQFALKRRAYRVVQLTGWPVPSATPYVFAKCLPVGFPRYPLMTYPGGKSPTCSWDVPSNDSEEHVFTFYKAQLNQGEWRIASIEGSTITFTERLNYGFGGTVTVDSTGTVHVTAGASESSNGPWTICQSPGS
jgi:hypothetical protein